MMAHSKYVRTRSAIASGILPSTAPAMAVALRVGGEGDIAAPMPCNSTWRSLSAVASAPDHPHASTTLEDRYHPIPSAVSVTVSGRPSSGGNRFAVEMSMLAGDCTDTVARWRRISETIPGEEIRLGQKKLLYHETKGFRLV